MPELSTLGSVIKTAYEGQANTHAFTDGYKLQLDNLAGGAVLMVQDEGSNLVARSILNFVGAGVTASDDGSRAVITIPGGGTSSGTVRASTGVSAQTAYTHSIDTALVDLVSGGMVPATAFGIFPNSGVDETTRIQNALLDLANEGPTTVFGRKRALYLQNGVYLTTGIAATTSTLLVGDGGAVLQFNGTHGANSYVLKVTIPGSGVRVTYGMLRGIKINGLSSGGELAETGVWFATSSDWSTLLSRVHIVNCGLYGVRVAGATNLLINDFRVDAVGRSAVMVEAEDTRRNLIALNGGTVTWNDPGSIGRWATQGYIASGSVGGAVAYWGAAVLELKHTGSAGGSCFACLRDFEVEWHFDGDPAGNGVVLDWNASTNANRPNRLLLQNISGFSDSASIGHQIVGFRGSAARQPIVTASQANLDGQTAATSRPVRDFTAAKIFGDAFVTSFTWAGAGTFFAANGQTMTGAASARPAANSWLNGFSYFATDTGVISYHVNNAWVSAAGGASGTPGHAIQSAGTPLATRGALNFTGAGVTASDDAANDRIVINVPGGTGGGDLSPFANASGSQSAAASAQSWKMTGNVTAVPITNGWNALYVNVSGGNLTITPASGTCVVVEAGATAASVTVANNKAVTVIGDGTNLLTFGDVV